MFLGKTGAVDYGLVYLEKLIEMSQFCVVQTCSAIANFSLSNNISVVDKDKDSIPRKIREALHIRPHGGRLKNRDSGLEVSCLWDHLLQ